MRLLRSVDERKGIVDVGLAPLGGVLSGIAAGVWGGLILVGPKFELKVSEGSLAQLISRIGSRVADRHTHDIQSTYEGSELDRNQAVLYDVMNNHLPSSWKSLFMLVRQRSRWKAGVSKTTWRKSSRSPSPWYLNVARQ